MEAQKKVPSRGLVGHLHFFQLFRQKTAAFIRTTYLIHQNELFFSSHKIYVQMKLKKILNSNML